MSQRTAQSCPSRAVLEELLAEHLGQQERDVVAAHVDGCHACRETLDHLTSSSTTALRPWPRKSGGEQTRHAADTEGEDGAAEVALLEHIKQARPRDVCWQAHLRPMGHVDTEELDWRLLLEPAENAAELGRLGGYPIRRVLGGGGMGIVFEAYDPQLQRSVALKVMRPAVALKAASRERFLREARAMAAIRHDNIVSVYQVGEDRGIPFLAMELLEGESLEARVRRDDRLNCQALIRLARAISQGLAAAHQRGLVHRDIKPANIFLMSGGLVSDESRATPLTTPALTKLKILDFGLARDAGDSAITHSGTIVGTPAYMAPEQVEGSVDPRADLFSLGCILYRLATGTAPYPGDTALSILHALTAHTPAPVRTLNPNMPAAVAELIMRLIARDPRKRPSSAAALLDELDQIEAGTWSARGRQRRRPWLLAAACVALVGLLLLGQTIIRIHSKDGQLTEIKLPPGAQVEVIEPSKPTWPIDRLRRPDIPVHELAMIGDGDPTKAPPEVVAVLGDSRLKHWGHTAGVAFLPDGKRLVSSGNDGVRFWDLANCQQLRRFGEPWSSWTPVAVSPDGKLVASAAIGDGLRRDIVLSDPETGKSLCALQGHTHNVTLLAFSPDGNQLASGATQDDPAVRLWDPVAKKPFRVFKGHTGAITALAFSPDGKKLASASDDRSVRIWEVAAPPLPVSPEGRGEGVGAKLLQVIEGFSHAPLDVCFAEDGALLLATGWESGQVLVWDTVASQKRSTIRGPSPIARIAIEPTGQLLAAHILDSPDVHVFEVRTGKMVHSIAALGPHGAKWTQGLAFSPDGKVLATVPPPQDRIRLWGMTSRKEIPLSAAEGSLDIGSTIVGAIVTPDGRTLIAAFPSSLVLWDLTTSPPKHIKTLHVTEKGINLALALSPNGGTLALASTVQLRWWQVNTLRTSAKPQPMHVEYLPDKQHITGLSFRPDGQKLAAAALDGSVRLYDAERVTKRLEIKERAAPGYASVAFSPDGKLLASGSEDGVRVFDPASGERLHHIEGRQVKALAFSPDGKQLAVDMNCGPEHAFATLWDVASGKRVRTCSELGPDAQELVFLSGGGQLAATGCDGAVRIADTKRKVLVWDIRLGPWAAIFWRDSRLSWRATLAPDGRHLITANPNGTVTIVRLEAPPEVDRQALGSAIWSCRSRQAAGAGNSVVGQLLDAASEPRWAR